MTTIKNSLSKNRYLLFLFLAGFFALPFERIPTLEVFGFTLKIIYVVGPIFLLLILFSGGGKIFNKKELLTSDWALILFWLLSMISLFWTFDFTRGSIIFLLWTFVFLSYLIFSKILTDQSIRQKVEDVIIIATILVCIFGLYQFIGDSLGLAIKWTGLREAYTKSILGFPRIQSVALEPLYFANFLLVPFFLCAKRYIISQKLFNPYWLILVLVLTNIILTISRGAYLAFGLSFFALIAYLFVSKYTLKSIGILAGLIVSIILSLGLIFLFNGKSAKQNFIEHAVVENVEADGSSYDRIQTYKKSIDLFKVNPILGSGLGSFGVLATPQKVISLKGYQTVNNEYLELLSETGLLGLTLFFLFLLFNLSEAITSYRGKNREQRMALAALILGCLAIFIQYNFFSTLYILYVWVFLSLLKGEIGLEKN